MEQDTIQAKYQLLPPALLGVTMLLLFYLGMREGYGHDEVEHMHVAYLMTQGMLPYVDFPQNHLPFFWWMLAPVVKMFPHSIHSFLFVRALQVLLLPVLFLCARRFIPCQSKNEQLLRDVGIIFSIFVYAIYCQWLLIRPDVMIAVLTSIVFWLLGSSRITLITFALCGLLLGLATLLSIKVYSIYLLVALIILFQARERGVLFGLKLFMVFSLCVLSLLVPFLYWLFSHEIMPEFITFVLKLNRTVPMTPSHRIHLLAAPLLYVAIAGSVNLYWSFKGKGEVLQRRTFIILFMSVSSFFALQAGNHGDSYNYLYSLMPLVVGTSFLLKKFYEVLNTNLLKVSFTIAIPCMLFLNEVPSSLFLKLRSTYIPRDHLEMLINFTKENEETTCTAFSPVHPVYCKDVSSAMLGWDFIFYEKVKTGYFRKYYTKLLKDAFFKTLHKKPDVIVIYDIHNLWTFLKTKMILPAGTVDQIWKFRNRNYEEIFIGKYTVWLKKKRFEKVLKNWKNIPDTEMVF